ncbi:MAG: AMP-dependent synthetase/ligase [Cyclonatronaceae bacterium]
MPVQVDFDTITELFLNLTEKYKLTGKTAFAFKPESSMPYETIDWDKFTEDVFSLAAYYLDLGIGKGDRIAILSENRYEWALMDIAAQLIGAVNVSLYSTLPVNQCEYILRDSGSKLFLVSTGIQLKKAVEAKPNCPDIRQVIAFDEPRVSSLLDNDYVVLFRDVIEKGKGLLGKYEKKIAAESMRVVKEDLATLIYTSGTTGEPKGVMLTHSNIVSNVKAAHQVLNIGDQDRTLSFLPLCHSFERIGGYYAMLAAGAEIYYAESVDTVSKNLVEAKPTVVVSVPRLFEKIYNLILKSVEEGNDTKKKIFSWAISVGRKHAAGKRGLVSLQKVLADKLVFDKLKQRTGGRVKLFVSGGAALPAEIGTFFESAGLKITEGYGLTETTPVITVNPFGRERYGTVGHVIPGVTVAIQSLENNNIIGELSGDDYPSSLTTESGEILCKGPNVMKGYWRKEEATREVIDDNGWFHTGDIGRFVDGYLQITDRLKHMIVNAGGKNIYPGPLEDSLKSSMYVDQCVILGEHQAYMAALIVPDFDMLKSYASQNQISFTEPSELLVHPDIIKLFDKELKGLNKNLASHEKVRQFRLLTEPFTVESGELTPTLKVKRRIIEDRYKELISSIYKEAGTEA